MMPPLPEQVAVGVGYWDEYIFGYTKGQMREYGQACADAERERCAKVCTDWANEHMKATGDCSYNDCDMVAVAVDLAEKIGGKT